MKQRITWAVLLVLLAAGQLVCGWRYSEYSKYTYRNWSTDRRFQSPIDFDNIDYPLLHAAIFYRTNYERARQGLSALKFNLQLEIAAYNHSKAMSQRRFFAHNNPYSQRRRTPSKRGRLAGITNPKVAENIANVFGLKYQGGKSVYFRGSGRFSYSPGGPLVQPHTYASFAAYVLKKWMNSPGHRKNILSTSGKQLGCGVWFYRDASFNQMPRFMATQNFQWFYPVKAGTAEDKGPPLASGGSSAGSNGGSSDDGNNDIDDNSDSSEYED